MHHKLEPILHVIVPPSKSWGSDKEAGIDQPPPPETKHLPLPKVIGGGWFNLVKNQVVRARNVSKTGSSGKA